MSFTKRYLELDALRGIAIIAMMIYHTLFDLTYFFAVTLPIPSTVWQPWSQPIAFLFLLLVGVCSTISWQRSASYHRIQKLFKRFTIIAIGALLISIITYVHQPESFVRFGILHLIAVATLLQLPFQRFGTWNVAGALLWWLLGNVFLVAIEPLFKYLSIWFLLPLGIEPLGFLSVDYYPIIPWFAVILLGMGIASWLYPLGSKGYFHAITWPNWLLLLGKQSLFVYLVHQPIIYGALWLYFRFF